MATSPSTTTVSVWRHPCVTVGTVVGACLAVLLIAWLLVANRAPSLTQFAFDRNLIGGAAIVVLVLVPFFLFSGSPARIFASCMIAWAILAVCYRVFEFVFVRLASQLGAFHLFVLGTVLLGVLAATDWVALLLLAALHSPLAATRR